MEILDNRRKIGKLISFTTFVVVLGHWFGGLLPEEDSVATIYIYPESTLEEKVEAVRVGVNEAGGHGDRICRVLWARGWDERLKPGKYSLEGTLSVGEAAEKLAVGSKRVSEGYSAFFKIRRQSCWQVSIYNRC